MENFASALKKRGCLVTEKEDHIYFSKGNHEMDLVTLKSIFNEFNKTKYT
ncbi:hypothetical protein [Evansella clarkii]|nr:hypothetical protein [Evansella clarkii]